ncbi:hypothetical protein RVF83_04455 [Gordonia rubripertincta]|uniref:Uncharacterized protein n=1 Tax=Gordonia rubripertincta TaxID=36822 RepID=A0AAW6REY0_GORRU|nr:hypothetical protein [Gordonia rubripertincta]ASR05241.1 hypothetical protein GCWB2_22350 [Gordonia rubripertincta]MDG6782256.1 hypothetical protein [Gordonia rubripertincta]
MTEDTTTSRWRRPTTYLTGRFSMLVTYPVLSFAGGLLVAYLTVR